MDGPSPPSPQVQLERRRPNTPCNTPVSATPELVLPLSRRPSTSLSSNRTTPAGISPRYGAPSEPPYGAPSEPPRPPTASRPGVPTLALGSCHPPTPPSAIPPAHGGEHFQESSGGELRRPEVEPRLEAAAAGTEGAKAEMAMADEEIAAALHPHPAHHQEEELPGASGARGDGDAGAEDTSRWARRAARPVVVLLEDLLIPPTAVRPTPVRASPPAKRTSPPLAARAGAPSPGLPRGGSMGGAFGAGRAAAHAAAGLALASPPTALVHANQRFDVRTM
jgi:hypothetical protein